MKRAIALLLVLMMTIPLAGCGSSPDPVSAVPTADPLAASPTVDPLAPSDVDPVTRSGGDAGLSDPLDNFTDDLPLDDDLDDGLADEDGDDPLSEDDPAGDTVPSISATPAMTPVPLPTPVPTPVAEVKLKDYQLVTHTDEKNLVSIDYPSHWSVIEPTENSNTIQFIEPTNEGAIPMRLALTIRTYEDEQLTAKQKKEMFQSFVTDSIKPNYEQFKTSKIRNSTLFINRAAFNVQYNGKLDTGKVVTGFVIMTDASTTKQVIAMHFSAPKAKFSDMKKVVQRCMNSVKLIKASNSAA